MPFSSLITDYYYNVNDTTPLSAQLNELLDGVPVATLSAELNELLDGIPSATLSAQMYANVPSMLILKGVDLATGQVKNFTTSDIIVRSDGSPYRSATGIQGLTGIAGVTGLIGNQGATGIQGITGVQGITGLVVGGITGFYGATGIQGITGFQPAQGITGLSATGLMGIIGVMVDGITGIMGLTGLSGVTGINLAGVTGFRGLTGLIGTTGFVGITGLAPLGISPQGATGIVDGVTGIMGTTGLSGLLGVQTVTTLSVQQQSSGETLSYAVPANTLSVNEQQIEVVSWGLSSTAGVSTNITITFGGATVLSTTEFGAGGMNFYIKGLIIRIGAASQENIFYVIKNSGTVFAQRTATAIDLTTSQTLTVTTTSGEGSQATYALVVRKVTEA